MLGYLSYADDNYFTLNMYPYYETDWSVLPPDQNRRYCILKYYVYADLVIKSDHKMHLLTHMRTN